MVLKKEGIDIFMKILIDSLHKIAYATDASVYREIPYGVAYPEMEEDVRELMQQAKEKCEAHSVEF